MGKLDELKLGLSPLSGKIYAGYVSKGNPNLFTSKVDITDQALACVADHLNMKHKEEDDFGGYGWPEGKMRWEPKRSE